MASGLKIITVPHPILRQKSQPVQLTPQVKKLIKRMKQTLVNDKREITGFGLAAVQVNQPLRIFLTINSKSKPLPLQVFINPQIIKVDSKMIEGVPESEFKYEGCLSIPNIYGLVKRHRSIKLQYQTINDSGDLINQTKVFSGLIGTIIQHEYDHLEGVLFIDRCIQQGFPLYRLISQDGQDKLIPLDKPLNIFRLPSFSQRKTG